MLAPPRRISSRRNNETRFILPPRRVSPGFQIITFERKEPTLLCLTGKKNKKERMKLRGRDKETIQAVSTMSCLGKLIRFSVMAGDECKKTKNDVFLRYASPQVSGRLRMLTNRTDFQEKLAGQEEREGERGHQKLPAPSLLTLRTCYKKTVR